MLQRAGEVPLSIREFAAVYARMYPDGQPGLPSSRSTELHERKVAKITTPPAGLSRAGTDPSRQYFVRPNVEDGDVRSVHTGDSDDSERLSRRSRVRGPPCEREPHIEARLKELAELERDAARERAVLLEERPLRRGGKTRRQARTVHSRAVCDDAPDDLPPVRGSAPHNLAESALLLRCCPDPVTPEVRQAHKWLHTLLEEAAAQQATSSFVGSWRDLREVSVGNFQGTYARPSSTWDLRGCTQKDGESLRNYIQRFSRLCNNLSDTSDAEIIGAFTFGTTSETLVRDLGVRKPRTVKELLDLATNHAEEEDALSMMLRRGKSAAMNDADVGPSSHSKKEKKQNKRRRRGDEDDFVAAVDEKKGGGKTTKTLPAKDHFEKLLEQPCPNHGVPVKHKLKDCSLMKRWMQGTLRSDGAGGSRGNGKDGRTFHGG